VSTDQTTTTSDLDPLFQEYGPQYGVPPNVLKAICMNESSLGQDPLVQKGLVSRDGLSWGVMQLTIPTASDFQPGITPQMLNDPATSVKIAAQFVQSLMSQFDSSDPRFWEWVIKSYNQGAGRTQQEIDGTRPGTSGAQTYWQRYQQNLASLG